MIRSSNVYIIKQIKDLLYNQGFTIEGAKRYLNNSSKIDSQLAKKQNNINQIINTLKDIKSEMEALI